MKKTLVLLLVLVISAFSFSFQSFYYGIQSGVIMNPNSLEINSFSAGGNFNYMPVYKAPFSIGAEVLAGFNKDDENNYFVSTFLSAGPEIFLKSDKIGFTLGLSAGYYAQNVKEFLSGVGFIAPKVSLHYFLDESLSISLSGKYMTQVFDDFVSPGYTVTLGFNLGYWKNKKHPQKFFADVFYWFYVKKCG